MECGRGDLTRSEPQHAVDPVEPDHAGRPPAIAAASTLRPATHRTVESDGVKSIQNGRFSGPIVGMTPTDGSVVITRLGTSLRWACTGSTTIADTINAVEGGGESVTTGRGRIRDIQ